MVAELSIVILNWRAHQQTLGCVAQIRQWRNLPCQLLVVDNEASDGSQAALLGSLALEELIPSQNNLGFAGGNNLGIARAIDSAGQFVLLLNSDAVVTESDVVRLLDRMRANHQIAVLGPVLRERPGDNTQCIIGGRDILRSALTREAVDCHALTAVPGYPIKDVEYVPGTVFLARSSAFKSVGLLDERFFFSGEIADFCRRVRDAGHRVCVDLEVDARHDVSATPQGLRDTLYVYYNLRNRLLYAKKHYPQEEVKYLRLWSKLCFVELGKALARGRLRKARAIALAMTHGCLNRFGDQNAAFI